MPELPEVETVCLGLRPVMQGQSVRELVLNRPDLRFALDPKMPAAIQGACVKTLKRRGKYIVMGFSNDAVLIIHLGMSGRMRIVRAGVQDLPQKHDHVLFELAGGERIIFNDARRFGYMLLSDACSWQSLRPFAKMGPEPLGNDFNGPVLHQRLRGMKTAIKTALLDQRVVAGIGNIYACEALFGSGISPLREAGSLDEAACERLTGAIKIVLLRAIEAGGSSLRDHRLIDGTMGYFQHGFKVYGRAGEPCGVCNTPIQKVVQSGRSSFYCPACQR